MAGIDKSYIVDASVILAGLLLDEIFNKTADRILEYYRNKKISLLAPTLLTFEVVNGIRSALIRKRVIPEISEKLIGLYKNLEIDLIEPDEKHILKTAISCNLSVYDSAYASLIHLKNRPLITADKKLYDVMKKQIKSVIWIEEFK